MKNPNDEGCAVNGITVRDYFAANAIQALLGPADAGSTMFDFEAKTAYEIADAMIAERNKGY